MLRFVLYDLTLFGSGEDLEQARVDLLWMLECLVQRNQDYLRQHPNTPPLYKSGVRYQLPAQFNGDCEEVAILRKALGAAARKRDVSRVLDLVQEILGGERFRDIGRVLENGGGDCDNFCAWRVAELRQAGIPARPHITWRNRMTGGTTYHALLVWPPMRVDDLGSDYWTTEDPSLLLGMSQPDRAADRAEEIRKNAERCQMLQMLGHGTVAEDVLGLRRGAWSEGDSIVAQIERALGRSV